MDYFQPDFYRFNEDSIKLAKTVASSYDHVESLLDVGAGSGVIGIEIARLIAVDELHFIEVQSEFIPYIEMNLNEFLPKQKFSITHAPFSKFQNNKRFEVIVCNPPYYLPGRGQPNKDLRKGICRSFQIDSWIILLSLFEDHLTSSGRAWVVIKNDKDILAQINRDILSKSLAMTVTSMDDLLLLQFTFPTE